MVAYGFRTEASAGFNLFFILMFIASHAVGQGAVIWVFIAEIFPNSVRAAGQAWGTGTHWVFAALITMLGEVVISVSRMDSICIFHRLYDPSTALHPLPDARDQGREPRRTPRPTRV